MRSTLRASNLHLDRINQITVTLAELETRIDDVTEPFSLARELLMTKPGISKNVANVMIAEAGTGISVFPTAGQLVFWAGARPGRNESAGHIKSAHTRPGNAHLKAAPGIECYDRTDTERSKQRLLRRMECLGYEPILAPLPTG